MATDYAQVTQNLCRFYDFKSKVVLYVGAAGRQLLGPDSGVRKLVAIDKNAEGLRQLKAEVAAKGLEDTVEVLAAGFEEVQRRADAVYFEFCLHEMEDPEKALAHAQSLAPDVVVYDHSPGSQWIYLAAEEEKVARSTAAMQRFGIRRRENFSAQQRFANYAELLAIMGPQGPQAVERIQRFRDAAEIVIPMAYEVNLL